MRHKTRKTIALLGILGSLSFVIRPTVQAEPFAQIRLFDTQPKVPVLRVQLSGQYQIISLKNLKTPSGPQLIQMTNHQVHLQAMNGKTIAIHPQMTLQATGAKGICIQPVHLSEKRCYAGQMRIYPGRDSLAFMNTVPQRQYVQGVLGGETPIHWPLEALKAQAVLTQTRLRNKHGFKNRIMVSDSTSDEYYRGIADNRPELGQAVQSVWGQYLSYQGKTIEAFYHSACAGHTSHDGYFKGSAKPLHPYSAGVRCPHCKASPFQKTHTVSIPLMLWQQRIQSKPLLQTPDTAKRFLSALTNGHTASAYSLWLRIGQRLGWDKVPGTRFQIRYTPRHVVLSSTGAGHGVGLCQWGSAHMARSGATYKQILKFYYPKTILKQ